jgi:hypothetical protein
MEYSTNELFFEDETALPHVFHELFKDEPLERAKMNFRAKTLM